MEVVPRLSFALVPVEHVRDARKLEIAAFLADEAGTYETLIYCHSVAPSLFLGAYNQSGNDGKKQLIGFIYSTLSRYEHPTKENWMVHDPEGKTIFVDCLCVDPRHQQQKVGSTLLREYIKRFTDGPYDGITLLAHEELIGFYVAAGFKLIGKSEVVEGSRPWFELRYSLRSQIPDVTTQRRILEVVREQNGQLGVYQQRKKLASHFPGGNSELTDERGSNKLPLYCPRVACRSVILTKGAAALVECFSVTIDDPQNLPPPDLLPHLQPPLQPISAWKIGPPANPMVFKNIGFSKTLPTDRSYAVPPGGSRPAKLLTCAECDLGPLGWVEEDSGGTIYWLVVHRVGYM